MNLDIGYTRALIEECGRQGLLRNQCAYVLATVHHETGGTMQPIYERGAKSYFYKYEPGTAIGRRLGNTVKGDGYLYRGRGFVQLTGRRNYKHAEDQLGVALVARPDLALDPGIAAEVLVTGSSEGWFTGKKLSDYITLHASDYIDARRVINGKDCAGKIAGFAVEYCFDLKAEGYGEQ